MNVSEEATTALLFADEVGSLRGILAAPKDRLTRAHTLWFAYPKTNRADTRRDTLWPILAQYAM